MGRGGITDYTYMKLHSRSFETLLSCDWDVPKGWFLCLILSTANTIEQNGIKLSPVF